MAAPADTDVADLPITSDAKYHLGSAGIATAGQFLQYFEVHGTIRLCQPGSDLDEELRRLQGWLRRAGPTMPGSGETARASTDSLIGAVGQAADLDGLKGTLVELLDLLTGRVEAFPDDATERLDALDRRVAALEARTPGV